jgi:hypothetical protein
VLRARAHLLHSRTDVNNANSLVLALSDLLERIRDEQRQRPLSPVVMGALEEEEEERDQREEEPEELFESMILFNGGNEQRLCPHSMDKKRSICQQSIAVSFSLPFYSYKSLIYLMMTELHSAYGPEA